MFSLYFCVAFERSGSVLHMIEFGIHADIERRLALQQPAWFGCSLLIDWILLLMAICLPACLSANRQLPSQCRAFERTLLIYDYYYSQHNILQYLAEPCTLFASIESLKVRDFACPRLFVLLCEAFAILASLANVWWLWLDRDDRSSTEYAFAILSFVSLPRSCLARNDCRIHGVFRRLENVGPP